MLDLQNILEAQALSALLAGACLLLASWPWHHPHPLQDSLGSLLGVSLGFSAGCWWLGIKPHWPPLEDQDRLLLLLLPTVVGVELLAAIFSPWRRLIWLARLLVAGAATRVLLHGTTYLNESPFPHSEKWSFLQEYTILGCSAIALGCVWMMLIPLLQRDVPVSLKMTPGKEPRGKSCGLLLALAISCLGTAITMILSSYASGGLLGFPLGAALAGVAFAGLLLAYTPPLEGALGLGIAGLFCLLIMGHFFGTLAIHLAILLLIAPLSGWLGEIPWLRQQTWWWLPTFWRPLGTSLLVVVVLLMAWTNFVQETERPAPGKETSGAEDTTYQDTLRQDYGIYRK